LRARDFSPPRFLRNPHLQCILASHGFRRWLFRRQHQALEHHAEEHILACGNGVHLQGFLTRQQIRPNSRGLAILLHGWEGSSRSLYLLNAASLLLAEGYDVFRLNFRDHGDTRHLNEELFHSCRLEEVANATKEILKKFPQNFNAIIGFSLGGNFALRVALNASVAGIPLNYVMAICPVISPRATLEAIESAPWFYQQHFIQKWRHSLRHKQALHQHREYFTEQELSGNLRSMTQHLVLRHTEFGTLENYLEGYSIAGDRLINLAVPATILAAEDDPVIPIEEFHALTLSSAIELEISPYGGHCGFIHNILLQGWVEKFIVTKLEQTRKKLDLAEEKGAEYSPFILQS